MKFRDGEYYDEVVETPAGAIRVLAEAHIFGRHLVLDEIMLYPRSQATSLAVGVREVLAITRRIRMLAHAQNFTELTVVYHRVGRRGVGDIITRSRRLP